MTNGADDVDEDAAQRVLEKKKGRNRSRSGRSRASGTSGTSDTSGTASRSGTSRTSGTDAEPEDGDGVSGTSQTADGSGMSKTSGTQVTSGTEDPWQQPLKELENISFYVTEEFKEEGLGLTQDMVNVKYRQAFGETLEKNREFRPLLLELGMEAVQEMDAEEIRERFEESDRLTDAPIADNE
ncbi:hypothetical protein [Natrinema thermotolerans]|uniref:hypothetical protein n=1 Tax=Natrinema thermotolerans TaxID=121872 RepID=UPI0010A517AD|nr:hypothetical protein [Natrinema thermotolerans]